jgi:hypothetical protein
VSGVGAFSFTLTISSNDADEATYTITVSGTGGTLPDISVRLQSVSVADGGAANAGDVNVSAPVSVTFTIINTGNAPLNLTGAAPVVTGGTSNCTAIVLTQPAQSVLAAGASTTFVIEVAAISVGALGFTVSISSDDPDENPYNFAVNAAGTTFTIGNGTGSGGGGGCSAGSGELWLICLPLTVLAGMWLRRRRLQA